MPLSFGVHEFLYFSRNINRFVAIQCSSNSGNVVVGKGIILVRVFGVDNAVGGCFGGFNRNLYPAITEISFDTLDYVWPNFVSVDMKDDRIHTVC